MQSSDVITQSVQKYLPKLYMICYLGQSGGGINGFMYKS